MMGAFYNRVFVGATFDDLSNFYILIAIQAFGMLLPLLFVWLIPLKNEIQKEQLDILVHFKNPLLHEDQKTGEEKNIK